MSYSLLCVQGKTPDDGQRNCPKHVEFYSKNKCEKLVHLVGFIIRICHDARSSESQIQKSQYTWRSLQTSVLTLLYNLPISPPPQLPGLLHVPSISQPLPWSRRTYRLPITTTSSHAPHYAACRTILALPAIPTTNYAQTPDCTGYNMEHQNSNPRRHRNPTPYVNNPSSLLWVRERAFRAHTKT